jgi:hypothetical protein
MKKRVKQCSCRNCEHWEQSARISSEGRCACFPVTMTVGWFGCFLGVPRKKATLAHAQRRMKILERENHEKSEATMTLTARKALTLSLIHHERIIKWCESRKSIGAEESAYNYDNIFGAKSWKERLRYETALRDLLKKLWLESLEGK